MPSGRWSHDDAVLHCSRLCESLDVDASSLCVVGITNLDELALMFGCLQFDITEFSPNDASEKYDCSLSRFGVAGGSDL